VIFGHLRMSEVGAGGIELPGYLEMVLKLSGSRVLVVVLAVEYLAVM
jgi:hypothetical protein